MIFLIENNVLIDQINTYGLESVVSKHLLSGINAFEVTLINL